MSPVAVVGGLRTPFVKAGGVFSGYHFLDLGSHVVKALVEKLEIDPLLIDEIVYSTVLLDPRMPNSAREIILRSNLPDTISAHFVSNNCISGLVAVNIVREGILSGRIRTGLAGGAESMSRPALSLKPAAEEIFIALARARSIGERVKYLSKLVAKPGLLIPQPPSPKEPSTGLTMGQHCEMMAKEWNISREDQDRLALRSHMNTARAHREGYLAEEIAPLELVKNDNIFRPDTSIEKLSTLKPVFDRSEKGTLTAGNSSPLTDGASVVCIMNAEEAARQERDILGYIEDVRFAGIDPQDGLLMAPAVALPELLRKNNLTIDDIDIFEIHEAFAAQVLANLYVWEHGWDKYNIEPIGRIPEEKINVNGGSIAIGHPFAATGGRLIVSALNELKRSGKNTAVISVCAAGAMACAMLLRRE
ncbi:MAG: acetyl-CoA C-acyltransferase [Candidatus Dadabacteria bacterium]|nr:MAG: acetyl-CoA C-acyltransferase [Candidatus Dadabacteria bacterium]